jgi:hypothetical protein
MGFSQVLGKIIFATRPHLCWTHPIVLRNFASALGNCLTFSVNKGILNE